MHYFLYYQLYKNSNSVFQCSILLSPEEATVGNSTVVPLILHLPSVSKQIHLVSDQPCTFVKVIVKRLNE